MLKGRATGIRVVAMVVTLSLVAGACTSSGHATETTSTRSVPSNAEIPTPPPPAAIAPVLRKPGPPGDAIVGQPTLLGGLVLADKPIVRTELWAGSELVEAKDLEHPVSEVRATWDWVPTNADLYGLVLRAIDAEGRAATSFPLWVRAVEPALATETGASDRTGGRLVSLEPDSGPLGGPQLASSELVAYQVSASLPNPAPPTIAFDFETCQATASLPAADGASGIALYAASFASAGFVPLGAVASKGGDLSFPLGSAPVMLYAEAYDASSATPSAPVLVMPPNECASKGTTGDLQFDAGILANAKKADRAYLYASFDGGVVWRRVPLADQTFVYPNADGDFDFSGLFGDVSGPAMFEAWGWVNDELTPLGRGAWTPEDVVSTGGATTQGPLVVGPYAGPFLPDSELDWNLGKEYGTGSPVLVRSGTICTYPPPIPTTTTTATVPVSVVGGNSTTSSPSDTSPPLIGILPDVCTNAPLGEYSEAFRWTPLSKGPTHGLLQISTLPPPDDPVLSFPGLVQTQKISPLDGGAVDFTVPIHDLIDPPAASADLASPEGMTYKVVESLAVPTGKGEKVRIARPQFLGGRDADAFYLRVVPMSDSQPLPGESNTVVITIDDTVPPPTPVEPAQPSSMSLEVQMTPPHLPNGNYERCVRVVENPFGSKNPAPFDTKNWQQDNPDLAKALASEIWVSQFMKAYYDSAEKSAFIYENGAKVHKGMVPGATVCAAHVEPPEKDIWDYIVDAVTFVGWVWDMFVTVWDKLKGWVADVIAYASGCVSIAEGLGKSHDQAVADCTSLTKSAIDYTLVAFGIPPTMPKFKDLIELGKGEFKDWLVKVAKDNDLLDCGPVQSQCDEMASKLLDQILSEMQVAATQAAVASANSSQWVLKIHPAIYVIPEPASVLSPAIFEIEITRSGDPKAPAPPASCTYTAYVDGKKAHYEWQNYAKGVWEKGPVSGSVMIADKVTVDTSSLAPGQSMTATLVLDKPAEWYPPGQSPVLAKVPYDIKPKTWIFFLAYTEGIKETETKLITTLHGGPSCGDAGQEFLQDKLPTEPWEIPS